MRADENGNVTIPSKLYDQLGGEVHDARAMLHIVDNAIQKGSSPELVVEVFRKQYALFLELRSKRHQQLYGTPEGG